MSLESIDEAKVTDLQEPRWLQCAFAAVGLFIAAGTAIRELTMPGPVNIGGVVLGETFGWLLFWLYVRELTKPR